MSASHRPHMVLQSGAGSSVQIEGTTITYKVTGAETQGGWSLVEYTIPPYAQGSPIHWHDETVEALYVLDGLLALTLDDQTITTGRGTMILVPPGVHHTFFNPAAAPVKLLAWFCPGGCEGYWTDLSALYGALEPNGDQHALPTEQLAALWHKYDHHHPSA